MTCDHSLFRCTNGVFFCLKCGQEIPNPYKVENEKPTKKKGAKSK